MKHLLGGKYRVENVSRFHLKTCHQLERWGLEEPGWPRPQPPAPSPGHDQGSWGAGGGGWNGEGVPSPAHHSAWPSQRHMSQKSKGTAAGASWQRGGLLAAKLGSSAPLLIIVQLSLSFPLCKMG